MLLCILDICKGVNTKLLGEHDNVGFGNRLCSIERDNLVVLENCLHVLFTFNDLVEGRVFEMVQGELCLFDLMHDFSILRLGSPLTHRENGAGLAELSKYQVAFFVEALELLAEAAAQSKGLDMNLK